MPSNPFVAVTICLRAETDFTLLCHRTPRHTYLFEAHLHSISSPVHSLRSPHHSSQSPFPCLPCGPNTQFPKTSNDNSIVGGGLLTRGQALLDLVCFVRVLQNEGVQVSLASDLHLDVLVLVGFLDAGTCVSTQDEQVSNGLMVVSERAKTTGESRQRMEGGACFREWRSKRTFGILSPGNFEELLDVCHFGRHVGGRAVLRERHLKSVWPRRGLEIVGFCGLALAVVPQSRYFDDCARCFFGSSC